MDGQPGQVQNADGARQFKPWMLLVLIVATAAAIGAIWFYSLVQKRKSDASNLQTKSKPLAASTPVAGVSPPVLPKVTDPGKVKQLSEYFQKVSKDNFVEAFMVQVPAAAGDAYVKYAGATPENKLATARAFYIYLDNPGVDKSDKRFVAFLADVKRDLEKTVGKSLF